MEAHKNYFDFNELVSSITRVANNLDEMTEIMTTKKVPEKAKVALNEWYGSMVMDAVRDKFLSANEIGKKDDEIQDLKLENDRLAKRDDKMRQVIRAIACDPDCEFCLLRGSDCSDSAMRLLAMKTLDELEEL